MVLSVAEAAAHLGVTPDAIRARLHRGTLFGVKDAGEWRVYLDTPPIDRQDTDRMGSVAQQDADRHIDRTVVLGELVAAKDETIVRLDAEVAFLRSELETRTDEL